MSECQGGFLKKLVGVVGAIKAKNVGEEKKKRLFCWSKTMVKIPNFVQKTLNKFFTNF